ncbi:MAG: hypothetical protein OEY23_02290 [Acidimicrobiia bacterium]|nr:hypothetical protein [Acidimicrobiia bacterium]
MRRDRVPVDGPERSRWRLRPSRRVAGRCAVAAAGGALALLVRSLGAPWWLLAAAATVVAYLLVFET